MPNYKPEWQIQIFCSTTGDRFTAAVFDKLLRQGPEAVREALEPTGENGSSRDRLLCLDVDLPALQQLVKDMKAKNHKKQQPATPAAAPGVLPAEANIRKVCVVWI